MTRAEQNDSAAAGFAVGLDIDTVDSPAGPLLTRRVLAAENAGVTFVTFADSPVYGGGAGRVDAVTRAAFVAATTSTVGLVPVIGTTYSEPFHVSSQLASLDHASRGRGGWIADRSDPAAAAALRKTPITGDAELEQEQHDSIEVVRRLWDSWEDDAVVRNVATGRFLDRTKLHYVDFVGPTFSVKGPAIVPRPPQGQLVVFGREGEADPAQIDAVLVDEARADGTTRPGGDPLVIVELDIDLGENGSAAALLEKLVALSDPVEGARLRPADLDADLRGLAGYVLPTLFERGIAHRPVPGSTLRASLGLRRPVNRHAQGASA